MYGIQDTASKGTRYQSQRHLAISTEIATRIIGRQPIEPRRLRSAPREETRRPAARNRARARAEGARSRSRRSGIGPGRRSRERRAQPNAPAAPAAVVGTLDRGPPETPLPPDRPARRRRIPTRPRSVRSCHPPSLPAEVSGVVRSAADQWPVVEAGEPPRELVPDAVEADRLGRE